MNHAVMNKCWSIDRAKTVLAFNEKSFNAALIDKMEIIDLSSIWFMLNSIGTLTLAWFPYSFQAVLCGSIENSSLQNHFW